MQSFIKDFLKEQINNNPEFAESYFKFKKQTIDAFEEYFPVNNSNKMYILTRQFAREEEVETVAVIAESPEEARKIAASSVREYDGGLDFADEDLSSCREIEMYVKDVVMINFY